MTPPTTQVPDPDVMRKLTAVGWFLLVTVLFGGGSLLHMLSGGDKLTDHQQQFFRAGHGHAGALATLGLLYSICLNKTNLSTQTAVVAWTIYAAGVFAVAGGMFLHAYTGEAGARSAGSLLSMLGGIAIAGAMIFLGWKMFTATGIVR